MTPIQAAASAACGQPAAAVRLPLRLLVVPEVPLLPTDLPATVLVPSRPVARQDGHVSVVLRDVEGAGLVLAAYSSVDELVRCCGPDQAWVALPAAAVATLAASSRAVAVVLDAVVRSPS
jgi:hypothetical protein